MLTKRVQLLDFDIAAVVVERIQSALVIFYTTPGWLSTVESGLLFRPRNTSPPSTSDSYWGLQSPSALSGFSQGQDPAARSSSSSSSSSSFETTPVILGTPLGCESNCSRPGYENQPPSGLSKQIQGKLPTETSLTPCFESSIQAQLKTDLMAIMADNNTHSYGWQSRPSHPLHPSSMAMDQQPFPQPQTLPPSTGYHVGYHTPQATTQGFYQPGIPAPQYLCSPHPGMLQSRQHPRSSSIPYSFPGSHIAGSPPTIAEHQFTSSPPSYLVNHQEYYYSQAPSLSSNPSSLAVSPQSQHIMTPGTVYSSPDTAPAGSDPEQQVRVISFRPKPQCWDHGCNGREFSTFSNLLRHQREKSGVVAKAECPSCGAVFTRTTARNIHVSQGKCKGGGREASSE
ncbi:hypothetical protein AFLA_001369 [Aspergillus flavus NRRL3357]|nr:hypothetical protein AFLA_001369 [Aspergillus flavus NRRL3357]